MRLADSFPRTVPLNLATDRARGVFDDKQAVVFAPSAAGFDITGDAIKRLDQQMPSMKINFNAAPPAPPKKKK